MGGRTAVGRAAFDGGNHMHSHRCCFAKLRDEIDRVVGGGLDQPAGRVVAGMAGLLVVMRAGDDAICGNADPDGLRGRAVVATSRGTCGGSCRPS